MLKRYVNLPVDFTLLTFIIALLASFLNKPSISSKVLNVLLWIIPFSIFYLITMVYSPSNTYSLLKAGKLLMSILSLFIVTIIFSKKNSFIYFRAIFKIVYVALVTILTFLFVTGQFSTFFITGDLLLAPDYLSISTFLATSLFLYLKDRGFFINTVKILSLLAILLLGGRGPFVITVILLLIYFAKMLIRGSFIRNLIIYFIVIAGLFILSVELSLHERTFERLASLIEDPTDSYLNPRYPMWVFAWESFLEKPIFGHGLGSFGLYYLNVDMRAYPHNLILEILFEAGVIGLILAIIFGGRVSKYLKINNIALELKLILFFFLLDFMKSNSIEDLRVFLIWIGIILMSNISTEECVNHTAKEKLESI
ncbi:MAG: O-antigen ligase family protein [Bacteroidetes bacterium]|nr:O-antigen ligase family protein [Bacteroidota bacterium]